MVGMLYKAKLVIPVTTCSDLVNHCQTFIDKPLISGQLIADTRYDGRVFPKLWCKFNLSIGNISEVCLQQ